jgi:hypothetical protein
VLQRYPCQLPTKQDRVRTGIFYLAQQTFGIACFTYDLKPWLLLQQYP